MDIFTQENLELILKLFIAAFCALLIGLERQLKGKPVGIRTSTLICMSTVTYIYMGMHVQGSQDATRVLGQVITGIGFLGAGVMINKDGVFYGVTSAAVVWTLAAVGCSIGFGLYPVAVLLTICTIATLLGVEQLEKKVHAFRKGVHSHSHGYQAKNDGKSDLADK